MDSLRALGLPAQGYFQRVVVINRLPVVVTLKKTDAFAVAQVDGWNNIDGFFSRSSILVIVIITLFNDRKNQ
jgi:hypothetical protein